MNARLNPANTEAAMEIIDPVFLHSPQFESPTLSALLGCHFTVKLEITNPIRSFKGRGASYFVQTLQNTTPLVCASAGNFGQAMAFACKKRGIPLTVFASTNANAYKLERMRDLGAMLILEGEDFDAAKFAAKNFANTHQHAMIEDGLIPAISEGAGTIALELLQNQRFDALVVPLGNGALLGGMAHYAKFVAPSTQIVAVQAAGAPAMIESWQSGTLVRHDRIATIADGIGVREPIPEALTDMQGVVDDGLLVQEDSLLSAMKLLHQHLGVVVEPSGAVGLAALLENRERFLGQKVATVICGGNLTPEQMRMWL